MKSAMKTLRTELEERKKQLTAARAELRRARERNLTLIDEMRDMHKLVESKFEQETPTSVASEVCGGNGCLRAQRRAANRSNPV